jgi:hypothetical protein
MALEQLKVKEIVRQAVSKNVDIPEFQREFVWDTEQVKKLPNRFTATIQSVHFSFGILPNTRKPRLLRALRLPSGLSMVNNARRRSVFSWGRSRTGGMTPKAGTKHWNAIR